MLNKESNKGMQKFKKIMHWMEFQSNKIGCFLPVFFKD